MIVLLVTFLVFLILGSALFSSSETALFSLSQMQVQGFKKSEDIRKQLVAKLLDFPGGEDIHPHAAPFIRGGQ